MNPSSITRIGRCRYRGRNRGWNCERWPQGASRNCAAMKVSFVIPVKDAAQHIRRCLASIVANDYPRDQVEVIVVDNDSSDGSAEAAIDAGATVLRSSARSVAELRNQA